MSNLFKKVTAVVLSLMMLLGTGIPVFSYGAEKSETTCWDGSSKKEPQLTGEVYQITSGDELAWLADYVNSGNTSVKAVLRADIDLGGKQWTPIGSNTKKFTGSFDGNGYAIHNLYIQSETNYIGLFGVLGAGASVADFYLDGEISSVYESNGGFAGGAAGYATGSSSQPVTLKKIRNNCSITVKGSSYGSYAGGIIGYSGTNVIIDRCCNTGSISGTQKAVGGIAGSGKKISGCYNTGYISGGVGVGGIAGICSTEEIVNCYNNGYIKGTNYVGGITALSTKTVVTVRNCYNTGMLEATAADGIKDDIAAAPVAKIENCYCVNATEDAYYNYGQPVSSEELRSSAEKLGEAFAINVHSEYQFGYPILIWELEEEEFQKLKTKEIRAVTLPDGFVSDASVKYGTQISEELYEILQFADEVVLQVDNGQVRIPVTWSSREYDAFTAGTYTCLPVFELPAGAALAEDAGICTTQVTVRENGAKAPYITSVELLEQTDTPVVVKYNRTSLGLPKYIEAVADGVKKKVYVQWKLPEEFSTTVPGVYEARAYFPEEYELAENVTMPVMTVIVKEQGFLSELRFSSVKNDSYYEMIPAFDETIMEYTVYVPDSKSMFYCEAQLDESVQQGKIEASYLSVSEKETSKTITSGEIMNLTQVVRAGSASYTANSNTVSIQAEDASGKLQTYVIHVERTRSLKSLKLSAGDLELVSTPEFANDRPEYTVSVTDSVNEVKLVAEATAMDSKITVTQDGMDGSIVPALDGSYTVSLPNQVITNVRVHVSGETQEGAKDYTIQIKKLKTAIVQFQVSPQAVVVVKDSYNTRIMDEEEGSFYLSEGETYTYSISKNGYESVKETFQAESGQKLIYLKKAAGNPDIPTDMTAQWSQFAKNSNNNSVISVRTPVQASGAALYWSTKLGEGYGGQATGAPLLVDGYMIVTAKDKIYKLNRFTGEILLEKNMCGASSFNIVPPTYAEGMIFVGLANGTIQAFRADTLESLWIYRDELKGQPNSPIKYHNGYIYTGFWNSETKNANFVCVSVTDEAPEQTNEDKIATWTYTQQGGFYWAGAYVCEDYLLVGTDDGEEDCTQQTSQLLSLNPMTGKVIDRITGLNGDIRSSVCYDEVTDRYYVTTKGGSFYGFAVSQDGTFQKDTEGLQGYALQEIRLGGMSTSTPVVYNGRAYVGVSGTSQFTADSGHGVAVLDLVNWNMAYKAETRGYPQTSGLLTTAYEADGYVYVYFIDNYTPGEVRYIKDKPGVTEVLEPYVESDGTATKEYAPILFTPSQAQAQYAICTPVADEYGTIYFKNDSAYIMAVGSNIERIEVAQQPYKTVYEPGEAFDAAGMRVKAVLSNGMERDITDDVELIAGEALQEGRREVSIRYGKVMYQDAEQTVSGAGVHLSNVKLLPLYTSVRITVETKETSESPQPSAVVKPTAGVTPSAVVKPTAGVAPSDMPLPSETVYVTQHPSGTEVNVCLGDADGNGMVDLQDARLVLKAALKISELKPEAVAVADANRDNKITLEDARLVLKAALKIITLE